METPRGISQLQNELSYLIQQNNNWHLHVSLASRDHDDSGRYVRNYTTAVLWWRVHFKQAMGALDQLIRTENCREHFHGNEHFYVIHDERRKMHFESNPIDGSTNARRRFIGNAFSHWMIHCSAIVKVSCIIQLFY